MNNQEIVLVVPVSVTKGQLESFLAILNKWEFDEDDKELTFEEVMSKPKLLEYICKEAVNDGVALFDPFAFWNGDGWCDIRDYR